jgi:hypothetical protein
VAVWVEARQGVPAPTPMSRVYGPLSAAAAEPGQSAYPSRLRLEPSARFSLEFYTKFEAFSVSPYIDTEGLVPWAKRKAALFGAVLGSGNGSPRFILAETDSFQLFISDGNKIRCHFALAG